MAAIAEGDLMRVKQLVSSGIGINTVLHCQTRHESTTLLGTAAYEGQVNIMQYLIQAKALINYQDPWLSRSALHWACIGGHTGAAELLISEKVDINCSDRDNVTPLIFAAMFRRCDIVRLLIENGANVQQFDRLHSTALHYASFHGQSDVVSMIIRAGGVACSPAIFGQGSPLANLFYHNDAQNCKLLVEAGYDLEEDIPWILREPSSSETNLSREVRKYLVKQVKEPPSLMRLSRICVRKHIHPVFLDKKLCKLPLPKILISYLCFT